jgi:hypothetical protein
MATTQAPFLSHSYFSLIHENGTQTHFDLSSGFQETGSRIRRHGRTSPGTYSIQLSPEDLVEKEEPLVSTTPDKDNWQICGGVVRGFSRSHGFGKI